MSAPRWKRALQALGSRLDPRGFDLLAATTVGAYHAAIGAKKPGFALPERFGEDALVAVVGNSRALWPALLDALERDPSLRASADPVDEHTRRSVEEAAEHALSPLETPYLLRFAFDSPPTAIDAITLAETAGLGHRSPSHLLVHPTHGPWIALRGAIVIDLPGPEEPTERGEAPCAPCTDRPCVPALEEAIARAGGAESVGRAALDRHYEAFLAVRVACPIGVASRYPPRMAEYHYRRDRRLLPILD